MKTTTKVWLGASALLALVVALICCKIKTAEPSYQGKSLSEWMEEIDTDAVFNGNGELSSTNKEIATALRAMGTNSVPILLGQLELSDSKIHDWIEELNRRQKIVKIPIGADAWKSKAKATRALVALGPTAKPFISQLVPLLYDTNKSIRATAVLVAIGPEAYPAILTALQHTNSNIRYHVLWGMGWCREKCAFAVPSLISMLNDQDITAQNIAIQVLGRIKSEPDITIPALNKLLSSSDPAIFFNAAKALEAFGTNSTAALLVLQQYQAQSGLAACRT
ncbi:MAG: HEAT repeat domain-containing protein [Verrucomicrobiota bacterium]